MNLIDQSLQRIGDAIRDRRTSRRMTLGDLAERSGLSVSFLSRVERGQAQSSVGNLIRIADALGGSIHDLIGPPDTAAPDHGFAVFRSAGSMPRSIPATGYRWTPVSTGGPGRAIEATLLELPAAGTADTRFAHPGEEICFVLEGRVRFVVGERTTLLETGDAIHLRSDIPHTAGAAGDAPARVLMMTHHASGPGGHSDWWNQGATALSPDAPARDKER
ncbi:XRE family transcriptional regulator [Thalassobaculum sp.]|uniref:helix-turn-helix domain-containing protein n=1 Tax=Thalassobaculum sp. TaxID=2022740 RepID=UPI0032EE14CF